MKIIFVMSQSNSNYIDYVDIREGLKKTYSEKVWSFAKPGGGGVSEGGEKTKLLF